MQNETFIVRSMQPGDIDAAMKLSGAESWNQTKKDWQLFLEDDGNICLVAESGNIVVGTTTAINYSNHVAWIGMVLVDKDYRGRGISKALLTRILKKLERCKSIKLDATPAGQQVYKQLDFQDEYLIARMTISSLKDFSFFEDGSHLPELVHNNDHPQVIALDGNCFGANRAKLIGFLLKDFPGKAWMLKQNNAITGFALGRDGSRFHHIGPVVASTVEDARLLLATALKKLIGQPIVVDVPEEKEELISWLTAVGFTKQRQFTRMFRKENPFPGLTSRQYLICGPEFG